MIYFILESGCQSVGEQRFACRCTEGRRNEKEVANKRKSEW